MPADEPAYLDSRPSVRLALQGWQQRVQAVIEIARDSDDLAARLPVLGELAHELVSDLERASSGLDRAAGTPGAELPAGTELLREAVVKAHRHLEGIEFWHRASSVGALRKARDGFGAAASRLHRA